MTVLKDRTGKTMKAPSGPRAANPPGKKPKVPKKQKVEKRTGTPPVYFTHTVTKTKKVA